MNNTESDPPLWNELTKKEQEEFIAIHLDGGYLNPDSETLTGEARLDELSSIARIRRRSRDNESRM